MSPDPLSRGMVQERERIDAAVPPVGELRLRVGTRGPHRAERSIAVDQYHRGALRILKPHHLDDSGQVTYTIINPGGAYFGGDRYLIDVVVNRGASLLLTTQSATKVYRTPQGPARQGMKLRLDEGSTLEYLPDQLIVYREGSYIQHTDVELHPSASLCMADIVTPGWSPSGEYFTFDAVRMNTEIRVRETNGPAALLAIDRLRFVPVDGVSGIGYMEGFSHMGQMILCRRGLDEDLYAALADVVAQHDADHHTRSGITRAHTPLSSPNDGVWPDCVVIRTLGHRTSSISSLHHHVVSEFRRLTDGRGPVTLRKP